MLVAAAGAVALVSFGIGIAVSNGRGTDDSADPVGSSTVEAPDGTEGDEAESVASDDGAIENDDTHDAADAQGDEGDGGGEDGEEGHGDVAVAAEPEIELTPAAQSDAGDFSFGFDGTPDEPTPFAPADWDITVHSRDVSTFAALQPIEAAHGPGCEPPTETHTVTAYADSVYLCRDHMMTAINAEAYAMIYVTPDQMVDFSDGEAVIRLDISTLRSTTRDWWDVWITPFDDNVQLPLDLGSEVDASGPPRRAIRVGLGSENQMEAEVYDEFTAFDFGEFPEGQVPGDWGTGYETFLTPDAARRDTFEIRISQNRLRVGMPEYDFWWIDSEIPDLDWTQGVVQFGHHSYNPTKDCNTTNTPRPPVDECTPMTWHWDNFEISPSVPFDIVRGRTRAAVESSPVIELAEPAPDGGFARFTGIGNDIQVRFDGGDWLDATPQATVRTTVEEHFTSYWMEIPAGTSSVEFSGDDWFGGEWLVRDLSVWRDPGRA